MKRTLAIILALVLVSSLCGCGKKEDAKEEPKEAATQEATTEAVTEAPTQAPTEAPTEAAKGFPVEGRYKMFAVESEGMCASSDMMGMEATISLYDDGTGEMHLKSADDRIDGEIEEWELDGENLTITVEGESRTGILKDGIYSLEIAEGFLTYFAASGADTSVVKTMTEEEFAQAVAGGTEDGGDSSDGSGSGSELADKLGIYSDDTHFVMDMYGVLVSYEHDGDNIIGCKGYIDALTEEAAEYAVQNYEENDPSVKEVTRDGEIVIITYDKSSYESLSLSDLETAFGSSKIER